MSVPVPGTGPSDEFLRSSAPSSSSRCDEDEVDEEDLLSALAAPAGADGVEAFVGFAEASELA